MMKTVMKTANVFKRETDLLGLGVFHLQAIQAMSKALGPNHADVAYVKVRGCVVC
jgi:hypothetical protein